MYKSVNLSRLPCQWRESLGWAAIRVKIVERNYVWVEYIYQLYVHL